MNKTIKGIISLTVSVLVIAVMVGALLWQRSREPEVEEVVEVPPQSVRIAHGMDDDLEKVTFTDAYGTVTMRPFTDDNDRRQWTWEGVDYQLNLIETRNKIRGAFSLFSNQVVYEDLADAPALNLADFGLSPPNLTITAYHTDGTTFNIYLGGPTPDFRGYFVMVEDNPGLFTIAALNAQRFMFGLEDMLDTSLPVWESETIQYVLIAQRGEEPIEMEGREIEGFEGFFALSMVQPFPDSEVFTGNFDMHVLEHLRGFRLGDLVNLHPTDLSPYGLTYPSLELIYRAPHGEAHLLFGDLHFRYIDGDEVAFIYVKFADRPHVFETLYEPVSVLYDLNVLMFISRFIALMNIQDVEWIEVTTPDGSYDLVINHVEDSIQDIEPTINGYEVDESDFRRIYRLAIGLRIDADVEPFTPRTAPIYTIIYTLLEGEDKVINFYEYDANFLAVSVDGEEVWFVTSRRDFDIFLRHLRDAVG